MKIYIYLYIIILENLDNTFKLSSILYVFFLFPFIKNMFYKAKSCDGGSCGGWRLQS